MARVIGGDVQAIDMQDPTSVLLPGSLGDASIIEDSSEQFRIVLPDSAGELVVRGTSLDVQFLFGIPIGVSGTITEVERFDGNDDRVILIQEISVDAGDLVDAALDDQLDAFLMEVLSGPDELSGTPLDDVLTGHGGNDILVGREGDDTLDGGDGNDVVDYGASGADLVIDLNLSTVADGLGGTDSISSIEGAIAGSGDDQFVGTDDANTFEGGAGSDTAEGGGGADTLAGGNGSDELSGGAGADTILGENGFDKLFGGTGADTMDGGAGNDRLFGQGGPDELLGDAGEDLIRGGGSHDTIAGGDDDDELYGGNGNDEIRGGSGDDLVSGERGRDKLFGDGGADVLDGGIGKDRLKGGSGADSFLFREGDGEDTLLDFATGLDTVDLTQHAGISDTGDIVQDTLNGDAVADLGGGDLLIFQGLTWDLDLFLSDFQA